MDSDSDKSEIEHSEIRNSSVDPITIQVIRAALDGIVQEMQTSLFRTGFSTIIRESHDASCALLNTRGEVIAQHVVLPLHMGAFPACVTGLLEETTPDTLCEGDAFIVNHPYRGGSPHAPDMAVLTPVFYRGRWVGFCASMAHKSDIGGTVPGSGSGTAREIFQEGLHLPPVKFVAGGAVIPEIERLIHANSRTPELVLGDIRGQVGANRVGERRLAELMAKYGQATVIAATEKLSEYTEARLRQVIASWQDGRYEGEACVDNDGIDLTAPVRIHVTIEKAGEQILFDFSGSSKQTTGPANIRPPLVRACCYYCLVALTDPFLPINQGLARVVKTRFREGTVVCPNYPAAVNTYMPTALVVAEAILQAAGALVPEKRIAEGSGSGAIALGGRGKTRGRDYVQYEIFAGGVGGRMGRDGPAATSFHLSNGKITPIEIVESEFPTRVERFELIKDSAGPGRFRGGLGFARQYRILQNDVRFSMRTDKHDIAPQGIAGGGNGRTGACVINPGQDGAKSMPSRFGDHRLADGDVLLIERPGGGGVGDPFTRDPETVLQDVRNGYVSIASARRDYGVAVRETRTALELDEEETRRLRRSLSVES